MGFLRAVWFGLFFICLIFLFWGFWPIPSQNQRIEFKQGELSALVQGLSASKLDLFWPELMRTGDEAIIEVYFSPVDLKNTVQSEAVSPSFRAVARLEMSGVELLAPPELQQSFHAGESIAFRWRVRSSGAGLVKGWVWFGIQVVSAEKTTVVEEMLAAPVITIRQVGLLSLDGTTVRWVGIIGLTGLAGIAGYASLKSR